MNGDLTAFHYPDEAVLHIQSVIVDGKYQRKGVGSQFVNDAVELARQLGARTITAEIRSEGGRALFEHVFGPEYITERLIGKLAIAGSEAPPKLVPYLEYPLPDIQVGSPDIEA